MLREEPAAQARAEQGLSATAAGEPAPRVQTKLGMQQAQQELWLPEQKQRVHYAEQAAV
jgi:hypothetical protein